MLRRALNVDESPEVRRNITLVTGARLITNSSYRFTLPFLAIIAKGLDVNVAQFGVAIAVSELVGLLAPFLGRTVDRLGQRAAMGMGLIGVAAGATLAAASQNLFMFGLALVLMGQSSILYLLGMGAWIAQRVPYERRGRVTGITEISWALGLLIGVSSLGLVTAATNWRVAYGLAAAATVAVAIAVIMRVEGAPAVRDIDQPMIHAPIRLSRSAKLVLLGAFALTVASQSLFVTFGTWLKEEHGFSETTLSAMAFALGAGELAASLLSAKYADRWGKERSMAWGAALMVPAAIALAVGHATMAVGLIAFVVAIVGFEFSIVSAIPIGSQLIASSPARGLGLLIGAETLGRSFVSIPATRAYANHGMAWPAAICAVAATCTTLAVLAGHRAEHRAVPVTR